MKAGTTTLRNYLREHEDIFAYPREIHFFDRERNYARGIEWYEEFFEGASHQTAIGEKTPSYCYRSDVPDRIYRHLPHARLIWILRDPVARAYSQYWHHARRDKQRLSFESAIKSEMKGGLEKNAFRAYLERGRYAEQIKRYLKLFPKDQMHFLLLESLVHDPERTLKGVFDFLQVNPNLKIKRHLRSNIGHSPRLNLTWVIRRLFTKRLSSKILDRLKQNSTTPQYPPMKEEAKALLKQYYESHNSELAELIACDLSVWG